MKPSRLVPVAIFTAIVLAGGVALWRKAHRAVSVASRPHAVERCDEHGWCTQSPPNAETMRGVWVAAANDVWTVDLGGSAWHFDGVKWTSRFTGIKFPESIYGFGKNAVWMVGSKQAAFWNGAQFTPFTIPIRGELSAVFGTKADDVWVASTDGMLAHWNGKDWSVVETPYEGWLQAIWGAKHDDLWAAGGQGEFKPSNTILHYDGRTWSLREIPCKCDITGLSGTAHDDVWAVGSWGTILHFDGSEWSRVPCPAPRGLMGVWAAASNDVWAVGEQGMVLHYDGKTWTAAKPDWKWFHAVMGTASGELWGVGQDGMILHWHGSNFRGLPKPEAPVATAAAQPGTTAPSQEPRATALSYEPEAMSGLDAQARAALVRARKLQSEGKFEQATAAFVEATGHGQTVNLRPLAEYAYAMLLRNDKSKYPDIEDMLLSSTKGTDSNLEAQAWFNLALLYDKMRDPEAERAALARSLARREHPSVRAKLKGRSSCVAELGKSHVTAEATVTSGWKGVCATLGLCNPGESLSEARARKRACVTPGPAGAPEVSHGCEGEGPWTSTFNNSMYPEAFIAPLHQERFFVVKYRKGPFLTLCGSNTDTQCELSGDYAVVSTQYDGLSVMPGRMAPQSDDPDGVCLEQPGLKTTAVFDPFTAKLLAAVTVVVGHPVNVTLNVDAQRLELSGGGCDGYVPLDGTSRWSPLSR